MSSWLERPRYQPVPNEAFAPQADRATETIEKPGYSIEELKWSNKGAKILMMLNLALFGCSIGMMVVALQWIRVGAQMNPELRRSSAYSPVLDILDLELHTTKLNGTLFPPSVRSIGRQMPNDDADAIWKDWSIWRPYPVTASQIRRMGKDPDTTIKLDNPTWGLGEDAYAAIPDVFHLLHCIDVLRKIAYGSRYNTSQLNPDEEGDAERHVNHCVDMLVQAIQCSGNTGMMTLHWVETQPRPQPDMSIERKCVNFEKMHQWRLQESLDLDKWQAWSVKPDGVKQFPMPEQYWKSHPEVPHEGNLVGESIL